MQKFAIAIIVVSILLGVLAYPYMPAQMATHWGISGEVNGYLPKAWGMTIMPSLIAVLGILFFVIPRLDPLGANIEKFRRHYNGLIILILLFLLVLQAQMILWGLGVHINPLILMPILLGPLFYYIGVMLAHSKRNWFMGIRTPWTLSSDVVWDKTHKLGARLFKACGILTFLGLFFPSYELVLVLVPVVIASCWTVVYSYLEYRKLKRK